MSDPVQESPQTAQSSQAKTTQDTPKVQLTTVQSLREIWSFFDNSDHKRFGWLYLLMLVNGVLEMAGLAAIFPVISILTSEQWREQWPILGQIQDYTGISGRGNFAIALMSVLFVYFLFRNAFRIVVVWVSLQVVCTIQIRLVQTLTSSVLRQDYGWLVQRNASGHIQLIQEDSGSVVGFLRNSMIFLAEATSTLCIVVLLIYNQPIIFLLLIAFLAVPAWLFQRTVRGYLGRISQRIRLLTVASLTTLREVFGAIKEVKVTGSEQQAYATYSKLSVERYGLERNNAVLQEMPKIILENAFLGGMVVIIALHVGLNDSVSGSLSYLGVLAIAGFRAVPVFNKALTVLAGVRFCSASARAINTQLQQQPVAEATARDGLFLPMNELSIQSATFGYHDTDAPVLKSINLQVQQGEMIGIVGTSGSGKTTLVDILLGLLTPESGAVKVNGHDIREDPTQWRQQTGYVPQSIFLVDNDVRHNVALAVDEEKIDDQRIEQALAAAQLTDVLADLAGGTKAMVGESGVRLSGGQRQRLGIARALYRQPQLLVLDEATSALDNATEARFMETVEAMHRQCTMIIIAHRLTTIAHCDRVYRLEKGQLTEVDPTKLA